MNTRILTVVIMFFISCVIGMNLTPTVIVQAAEPITFSKLELPKFPVQTKEKSVDEINVEIDLSTKEVQVKSTTDAIINVTTTGKPKPVVKYKIVEKEVNTGFPYMKSMRKVSETPISPINIESYEE